MRWTRALYRLLREGSRAQADRHLEAALDEIDRLRAVITRIDREVSMCIPQTPHEWEALTPAEERLVAIRVALTNHYAAEEEG